MSPEYLFNIILLYLSETLAKLNYLIVLLFVHFCAPLQLFPWPGIDLLTLISVFKKLGSDVIY